MHSLSAADAAALEARIRALEAATGVEAVVAVVPRSDRYHGLRWRAFALGVAVAAIVVVAADILRPDWVTAHTALLGTAAILGAGLVLALAATLAGSFERWFIEPGRGEREARKRAQQLFLERELFATPARNAILLFASRYEHAIVVFGDTAYAGRVSDADWQRIVAIMTPRLTAGDLCGAFIAGLDALDALLAERGFKGDGRPRGALSNTPIDDGEKDE